MILPYFKGIYFLLLLPNKPDKGVNEQVRADAGAMPERVAGVGPPLGVPF